MRLVVALSAFVLVLSFPALAQTRPQGQVKPPQAQPQTQPQAPEPPPGFFACRTAAEVCYIGVVTGASQVAVLFTNAQPAVPPAPPPPAAQGARGRAAQPAQAPQSDDIGDEPINVSSGDSPGTPLDLAQHLGRVVMLTGTYDPKAGLTKAELVDVAGPLLSFALKAALAGGDEQPGPPAQSGKPQGKR
jgi:hypothetical protein